mgnify:FL=1
MAEYIKREAIINRIKEYALDVYGIDLDDPSQFTGNVRAENFCEGLYEATELVDDITTADVAPVLHGDWKGYFPHCSVCGEEALSRDNGTLHGAYFLTDYCPNCGAKMTGGTTDEL